MGVARTYGQINDLRWGSIWEGETAAHRPLGADFDGDGLADRCLVHETTGQWIIRNSSGQNRQQIPDGYTWGGPNYVAMAADFDGDDMADRCLVDRTSGFWHILTSSGRNPQAIPWGWQWLGQAPGHVPLAADFDGDGLADRCLVIPDAGYWHIIFSSGKDPQGIPWGWQWLGQSAAHVPLAADFDGDGMADRCLVERSTGHWHIIFSSGKDPQGIPWGWQWLGETSVHEPFAADFDGDGMADRCIVNRETGEWFVLLSKNRHPVLKPLSNLTLDDLSMPLQVQAQADDDGKPGPLSYAWSTLSGPATVEFGPATAPVTWARFAAFGDYVLQVTASDGELSDTKTCHVQVFSPPSIGGGGGGSGGSGGSIGGVEAIQVKITGDQSARLNTPITLTATITGASSVRFSWSAASAIFSAPNSPKTTVQFTKIGTYQVTCVVQDQANMSHKATHSVVVRVGANSPPVISGLPASLVLQRGRAQLLSAIVTDDGQPNPPGRVITQWRRLSGPATLVFSDTNAARTYVTASQAGRYIVRLTASDGERSTEANITLIASGLTADAGRDRDLEAQVSGTVNLGSPGSIRTIRTTLSGSASGQASSSAARYQWTFLSGPNRGHAILENPSSSTTAVTFDLDGEYHFALKVSDDAGSASDTVKINIRLAPPRTQGFSGGAIRGTITTSGQRRVNGATVSAVKNGQVMATVKTGPDGSYTIQGLYGGLYSVKAEWNGRSGTLPDCALLQPNAWYEKPAMGCNVYVR
jgi:hypothetical protein